MKRAVAVLPAGTWNASEASDDVLLDHDHRHRRRIALHTKAGAKVLLDLPETTRLRDGDGLALQGGGIVLVRATPEPLLEIRAQDDVILLRITWHLGNRHLPVQVVDRGLRTRADRVIADMVQHLGGRVEAIDAPFDPEAGAYAVGHHHDDHH
jgi:urease accessory protein